MRFGITFPEARGANLIIDTGHHVISYDGCRHTRVEPSAHDSVEVETVNIAMTSLAIIVDFFAF